MPSSKKLRVSVPVQLKIDGAPHLDLANVDGTAESALAFFRRWRKLFQNAPEPQVWLAQNLFSGEKLPPYIEPLQLAALRAAWRGDKKSVAQLEQNVNEATLASLQIRNGELALEVDSWPAVAAAFLTDLHAGRAGICARDGKGCKTPYFLKERSTRVYCNEKCQHEALNEKRLDWWNRVGSKRRAKRKPKG